MPELLDPTQTYPSLQSFDVRHATSSATGSAPGQYGERPVSPLRSSVHADAHTVTAKTKPTQAPPRANSTTPTSIVDFAPRVYEGHYVQHRASQGMNPAHDE